MTLKRLRQYLPVTKVDLMRHKRDGWIRRIDVASAIFKCILQDRLKYIQGDYPVAWAHWQRLAQELVLVLDGAGAVSPGKWPCARHAPRVHATQGRANLR